MVMLWQGRRGAAAEGGTARHSGARSGYTCSTAAHPAPAPCVPRAPLPSGGILHLDHQHLGRHPGPIGSWDAINPRSALAFVKA